MLALPAVKGGRRWKVRLVSIGCAKSLRQDNCMRMTIASDLRLLPNVEEQSCYVSKRKNQTAL
jgi:hypothetical protein